MGRVFLWSLGITGVVAVPAVGFALGSELLGGLGVVFALCMLIGTLERLDPESGA